MTHTKDKLIAAKQAISMPTPVMVGDEECARIIVSAKDLTTIRTLIDNALNPPDLDATIAQCVEHAKRNWREGAWGYIEGEIVVDTVRLLSSRIVREGCVVVDATEYQQLKNIQNALQANINMIAAKKVE